ncbi:TlpA family protein disulfide reductase [Asticcacaulis endophyticus]|uniref:Thiol:disulfide interchange protein n=1 Tax=Asticcacaulis endophyticus TaxID=1395890 RepID=A0A918Q6J5_9CAUL|nr:TlpA disulfide reductase family protein [Asticcacaulis endophyticus]GGZ34593.1 thiol:disulfide interchange protein [Asticcacaulis endophyticus]
MGEVPDENNGETKTEEAIAPVSAQAKSELAAKSKIVEGKKNKRRLGMALGLGVVAVLGVGLFKVISLIPPARVTVEQTAQGPLKAYATGTLAKLITHETPKPLTDIEFYDGDKKPVHVSDFAGKVVVLNVWATWCAPCRVEMPTLARLQGMYPVEQMKVLPLSVDTEDKLPDVKSFIGVHEPLGIYNDPHFAAPSNYVINAMPTTLIIDKQGREVARLEGEAHWDKPEVKALLDKLLTQ